MVAVAKSKYNFLKADKATAPAIDNVDEWLLQSPPDWERAEMHGAANRVVVGTVFDPARREEYCPCCNKPYVTGKNLKGVCCQIEELGFMGNGYPLFLMLYKSIGWFLVFLTVAYSLPSLALMSGYISDNLTDALDAKDYKEGFSNVLQQYSFGAFLVDLPG